MKFCVVKRKATLKSALPLFGIMALSIAIALLSMNIFVYIPFFVLAAGLIVALILAPRYLKCEYEYNLEGDSFSVALIRNKSSRKELFSCDIEHLISCEPYTSQRFIGEKIDATSYVNTSYIATFSEDGKQATVLFTPDDDFVRELRLLSPSKVKLNIL